MEFNLKKVKLLFFFFIFEASSQLFPIQPSSHEFYVTEIVRVKRQAGYVYDKPSKLFNLPSKSSNAPTETTNVDRTQEQYMYYAYPVPSDDSFPKPRQLSSTSGSTSNLGSGYNYGTSTNIGAPRTTSTSGTISSDSSASILQTASGYNYNSPSRSIGSGQISTASRSTATSSVSVGYGYGAPSSTDSGQADINLSSQDANEGATETDSDQTNGKSAGYGYNTPAVSSVQRSTQTNSGYSLTVTNSINSGYGAPPGSFIEGTTNSNYEDQSSADLPAADRSSSVLPNANSLMSGYSYDVSLKGGQPTKSSSTSSATSSVSTNYNYDLPVANNQGTVDTFTSAPQYLPPTEGVRSGVVTGANDDNFKRNTANNYGSSDSIVGYNENNNLNVGMGDRTTDYGTGDVRQSTNNGDPNYNIRNVGYGSNTEKSNSLTISSDVGHSGSETSDFGGYAPTRGTNEPFGFNDNLSSSVSVLSAGAASPDSAAITNSSLEKPTNTYVPNSSPSKIKPLPPSQTYISSLKNSIDSSPPFSGDTSAQPVVKPSGAYIRSSSVSNIPSSLSSSSKPSNVPIQNYIESSRDVIRPLAPLESYIPSSKSFNLNTPGQSYVPSISKNPGPAISQPSANYSPQNIKSLNSLSQVYVPQTRSPISAGQPSANYVPQVRDTQRPTLKTPSLNYIPPDSRPSVIKQINPASNKNYLLPNDQSAPSVPVSNSGPLQPFNNYLPLLPNSLPVQQTLPNTYLPPIV